MIGGINSPEYKHANAVFSQNLAPDYVVIGKRYGTHGKIAIADDAAWVTTGTIAGSITINSVTTAIPAVTYATSASASVTALINQINTTLDGKAVAYADDVTGAGLLPDNIYIFPINEAHEVSAFSLTFSVTAAPTGFVASFKTNTTAETYVETMTDIVDYNNNFIAFAIESDDQTVCKDVAIWAETNGVMFSYVTTVSAVDSTSAASEEASPTTTPGILKNGAYENNFSTYFSSAVGDAGYSKLATLGYFIGLSSANGGIGSAKFAFKTIKGTGYSYFTTKQNLIDKYVNFFDKMGGKFVFALGKTSSGKDVDFVLWKIKIKEKLERYIANAKIKDPKAIAMSDAGIAIVASCVGKMLSEERAIGAIADKNSYDPDSGALINGYEIKTYPYSSLTADDIANKHLNKVVEWTAVYQAGSDKVTVNGVITQ
jgi:hypothetical protein